MAGNDISQTLAMLTGGTEITQNAQEMGTALRTISLRLRGMKGELEDLGEETEGIESISKIQTQILNLTNKRVNIFKDNGEFKSTYEILKEISEIYNDLSSTSQASLTEIMFGKTRANQGTAILQAFQSGQIEKAYQAAENSANSAQKEFDRLSEGIESHINDFKNAFETLSTTVVDSDLVKFVVDSGTTILNVLNAITDKVGVLPTLLAGLATIGSFKGVGRPYKPNMPKLTLLQNKMRGVIRPYKIRAFQMLGLRVVNTQPKAV
jgi:TP901 family phage tail tape measure protein